MSSDADGPGVRAFGDQMIVWAKLLPLRARPSSLERPRLTDALRRAVDVPVTLVRAPAGYGKTTALARLVQEAQPAHCYSLSEADADPLVFLLHLVAAFRGGDLTCGQQTLAVLQREGGAAKHWVAAVDSLANDLVKGLREHTVLVLDDFHAADSPLISAIVDRLVQHAPPTLHVVIATRQTPSLPRLARWQASGEALVITKAELAFTAEEARELFVRRLGIELGSHRAGRLTTEVEGWAIALQMLCQNAGAEGRESVDDLIDQLPGGLDQLFDYLAEEVFRDQPIEIREFLLASAALRRMDAATCDQLLGRRDSDALLRDLEARSLFLTALGGGAYRYHHLFQDFLAARSQQTSRDRWRRLHRKAATLFQRRGDVDEAIHHAFAAGSLPLAAALLEQVGPELVQAGRYETLATWAAGIPTELLDERPTLLRSVGDAERLRSRFDPALDAYRRARDRSNWSGDPDGESRALEGAALVYLDTARPTHAAPLLDSALRLVDPDDRPRRAHLMRLLAENSANSGDLTAARRIVAEADDLEPTSDGDRDPRMFIRQGRLAEARAHAEQALRREESSSEHGLPRSHRESTIVLAWIAALEGDQEASRDYAERALQRGRELDSPSVALMALARLGHAWLTGPERDPERALSCYERSLQLAEQLNVPRFRVEALLGQVVAHGGAERLDLAHGCAEEAVSILEQAGDRYLAALVWLALGGVAVSVRDRRADTWLDRGAELADAAGDPYCVCIADLWRVRLATLDGDWERFDIVMGRLLERVQRHGYRFLLTAHPFPGLSDPADLVAILEAAERRGIAARLASTLLARLAPARPRVAVAPEAEQPPFEVHALGPFRLWRDGREIPQPAWARRKALTLFQFLVAARGHALHRERVQEALWPDAEPEASGLSLRVTLSALQRALKHGEAGADDPRLVRRDAGNLVLDGALLRVDADEFAALARRARDHDAAGEADVALALHRRAIGLYRGDFLEERPYDDWAEEERRNLRDVYLRAAERAAGLLLAAGAPEEAIEICEEILARDRCWEPAYAQLLRGHTALGNRALALRTYDRCAEVLRDELAADTSEELKHLRAELMQ